MVAFFHKVLTDFVVKKTNKKKTLVASCRGPLSIRLKVGREHKATYTVSIHSKIQKQIVGAG